MVGEAGEPDSGAGGHAPLTGAMKGPFLVKFARKGPFIARTWWSLKLSGVLALADRERADLLRQIQLMADQIATATRSRNDLICKAFSIGVPQRRIALYAQVNQATVSRIIAQARVAEDSVVVGR